MNEKKITLELTLEETIFIQLASSLVGGGKELLRGMAKSPESSIACVLISTIVDHIDTDKLQGKIQMAIQSSTTTCN